MVLLFYVLFIESMDNLERMAIQNEPKNVEKPHLSYNSSIPVVKPSLSSTGIHYPLLVYIYLFLFHAICY